jgi:hypothetical protein
MAGHLIIELSKEAFKFTSLNEGLVRLNGEHRFIEKQDNRYRDQLDQFIESSGLKSLHHEEHTISWSSEKTTLVPANVFAETDSESVFRLCFGKDVPSSDVDYNRIPEAGIVNVFEIPLWVKSYFVVKHPRSVIQHESTMLLRGLMSNNSFGLKILLVPYENHFFLTISKHGKLQFYSVFQYQNAEDILYYLTFTLQQKEMLEESADLLWTNGIGADPELYSDFEAKAKKVHDLKPVKITTDQKFILNSHLQCV